MIDYTQFSGGFKGSKAYFEEVVLTCRASSVQDCTQGRFALEADPKNDGFKIYILSDITPLPHSATHYSIKCMRSLNKETLYLKLTQGGNAKLGYKVISIVTTL